VIAVDTNILVYEHLRALARLRALAEGEARWAIPVFCLGEFVRVVTHAAVFQPPSTLDEAVGALDALLESPSLLVLSPGERYWPLLREALSEAHAAGNLAFDAQIVAVCRESGVRTLLTEDRDFRRFSDFPIEGIGR
jgi:predicted nucleic acid-binding protein